MKVGIPIVVGGYVHDRICNCSTYVPAMDQRCSHAVESGAGADTEMDIDSKTDNGDEIEAEGDGLPHFVGALMRHVAATTTEKSCSACGCTQDETEVVEVSMRQ